MSWLRFLGGRANELLTGPSGAVCLSLASSVSLSRGVAGCGHHWLRLLFYDDFWRLFRLVGPAARTCHCLSPFNFVKRLLLAFRVVFSGKQSSPYSLQFKPKFSKLAGRGCCGQHSVWEEATGCMGMPSALGAQLLPWEQVLTGDGVSRTGGRRLQSQEPEAPPRPPHATDTGPAGLGPPAPDTVVPPLRPLMCRWGQARGLLLASALIHHLGWDLSPGRGCGL